MTHAFEDAGADTPVWHFRNVRRRHLCFCPEVLGLSLGREHVPPRAVPIAARGVWRALWWAGERVGE